MARKKSPRVLAAVLVATSVAAQNPDGDIFGGSKKGAKKQYYRNKSVALTLSHSVLSSGLPLDEILLSSGNVTFILPPYLSVDDLTGQIASEKAVYDLPQTLIQNYKLLQCSNMNGYFRLLKNLRPDTLFVCADDLGIGPAPPDLRRFVKEIVTIDQGKENVYNVLSEVFLA